MEEGGVTGHTRVERRQLARNPGGCERPVRTRERRAARRGTPRGRSGRKPEVGAGGAGQRGERNRDAALARGRGVWEKAGARGRRHGRFQGGQGCRTKRAGGGGRRKSGGTRRPPAEAARRLGGPNPPTGGPAHSREGTGDAAALTGVPPHRAAGGVRPQVREEEVPGGLEVLEVAELDDGAGHGCGERGSGTLLTSLATPCPPPPRRRARTASATGGGDTRPEAVSARGSPARAPRMRAPVRSAARRGGSRERRRPGSRVRAETWRARRSGPARRPGTGRLVRWGLGPAVLGWDVVRADLSVV